MQQQFENRLTDKNCIFQNVFEQAIYYGKKKSAYFIQTA